MPDRTIVIDGMTYGVEFEYDAKGDIVTFETGQISAILHPGLRCTGCNEFFVPKTNTQIYCNDVCGMRFRKIQKELAQAKAERERKRFLKKGALS